MRHTAEIVITDAGRDKGKRFLITEMDAFIAERWAMRAIRLLVKAGVDIDMDAIVGGWAALAGVGVRALLLALDDASDPLLDEMMDCVQFVAPKAVRALVATDIEEVATILRIRDEVIRLHTGFSIADALSSQASALKTMIAASSASPTSPSPSE